MTIASYCKTKDAASTYLVRHLDLEPEALALSGVLVVQLLHGLQRAAPVARGRHVELVPSVAAALHHLWAESVLFLSRILDLLDPQNKPGASTANVC